MYASYRKPEEGPTVVTPTIDLTRSHSMGKVYLYMGLALLISSLVAFGAGALFAGLFTGWTYDVAQMNINASHTAFAFYMGTIITSGIGVLICGVAMHFALLRGKHSLWAPYTLYAIFIGLLMSVFLVVGVDFATLGEAFGISALAFVGMGLIGYYSKKDLNVLGMVGLVVLLSLSLFGMFSLFTFLWLPRLFTAYTLIYNAAILVVLLIMVAVDTYNIKRIMANGSDNPNLCLYCAYMMYTDFINILFRVILILARSNSRR